MTQPTHNPAARYAQAIEFEKSAWHALQAEAPGSNQRAQAWATWSEAISRTNHAWRQLSSQSASRPSLALQPSPAVQPGTRPFPAPANAPAAPLETRRGTRAQ